MLNHCNTVLGAYLPCSAGKSVGKCARPNRPAFVHPPSTLRHILPLPAAAAGDVTLPVMSVTRRIGIQLASAAGTGTAAELSFSASAVPTYSFENLATYSSQGEARVRGELAWVGGGGGLQASQAGRAGWRPPSHHHHHHHSSHPAHAHTLLPPPTQAPPRTTG